MDEGTAWRNVGLIKILTAHQRWFEAGATAKKPAYQVLSNWLQDDDVNKFLQVNRYQGVLWFNKESYDQLLQWLFRVAVIALSRDSELPTDRATRQIMAHYRLIAELRQAEQASRYQVERLLMAAHS